MSTGLKVWLWIWFILGIFSVGGWTLAATVMAPILADLGIPFILVMGLANALLMLVTVVGIALILFGRKKIGLYLMIASAAIGFIFNIIGGYNIFVALIGQGLLPAITFWIMAAEWHAFD